MKHTATKISIGLVFFMIACISTKKISDNSNWYYTESKLDFFDPYSSEGDSTDWIRKPKNIRVIHETFKKVGYHNLIDSFDLYSSPCMLWGYVNRPCNEIIDSLIITYSLDSITEKYYREFWLRRKKEHNDKVVYEVLIELNQILFKKTSIPYNDNFINDTIYRLALISLPDTDLNKQKALEDFDYLKEIGLHYSAFNLLYETYKYQDIKLNRDSLKVGLEKDSVNCCPRAFLMDDTK